MAKNLKKNGRKGFTIIEVVLVLAIAGLIFLMVFIALPALQRSQRNTERKSNVERVVAAINGYQSNNGGKTPFDDGKVDANFIKRYVDKSCTVSSGTGSGSKDKMVFDNCGAQFKDPDGSLMQIAIWGTGAKTAGAHTNPDHVLWVRRNASCSDSEGSVVKDSGNRDIAILYRLEGGSYACNDNH